MTIVPQTVIEDYTPSCESEDTRLPADISKDERMHRAFALKMRGFTVADIARVLKVNRSTIDRDLSAYTNQFRESLEQEPAANIIAESVLWLDDIERMCLFEAQQSGDDTRIDPEDGTATVIKSGDSVTKNRWVISAMKAREMKTKLLSDTGVIPKDPDRIYHRIVESKIVEDGSDTDDRDPSEMAKDILRLVENTKTL